MQITGLKQRITFLRRRCAAADADAVEAAISKLPEAQKMAVQACFAASNVKGIQGMRYNNQWIFECLLLRIKSRRAYEHIRKHKILVLPCKKTLDRYIQNMKGTYGFQQSTFDVLKQKTTHMEVTETHGT